MHLATLHFTLFLLCQIGAALLGMEQAHAATIKVLVSDAQGRPVQDAVLMLDSASGRLPVKPMPQVDLAQSKRQFVPQVTVITVGTAVNFPNYDTVRHHVYSFSPIKSFELKLYAGKPSAPVVFDKPGVAVLGCNIHDQMAAWVVVVDTPYHARTSATGEAWLEGVHDGQYNLKTWHAGVPLGTEPAVLPVTVSAADQSLRIQLQVSSP